MDLYLITKLLVAPDSYNISSIKNIPFSTILHLLSSYTTATEMLSLSLSL